MDHNYAVIISGGSGESSKGEVTVVSWDKKQRLRKSLRWLGILWGLAIFSVFLPIVHFILVPSFLLAGVIVAMVVSKKKSSLSGQGTCPFCNDQFKIASGPDVWPISDVCEKCKRHVTINKVQGP